MGHQVGCLVCVSYFSGFNWQPPPPPDASMCWALSVHYNMGSAQWAFPNEGLEALECPGSPSPQVVKLLAELESSFFDTNTYVFRAAPAALLPAKEFSPRTREQSPC